MRHVYWLDEVDGDDISIVGHQGAKLAELKRSGFPIPRGFIISTDAYHTFLRENNLLTKINHLLAATNFERSDEVAQTANHIKRLIHESEIPHVLLENIFQAYRTLSGTLADNPVSIKLSSAQLHSSPSQQKHTIVGDANLVMKLKDVWASHFDPQHLGESSGTNGNLRATALIVQQETDAKSSGILLTSDPITNNKSKMILESVLGNVSSLTKGLVIPDHIEIDKNSLQIVASTTAIQTVLLDKNGKETLITPKEGKKQKISHSQAQELAELGKKMEDFFLSPLSIEWAMDGRKISITRIDKLDLDSSPKPSATDQTVQRTTLLSGTAASRGIATGPVKVLSSPNDFSRIAPSDVIVATSIDPYRITGLKKASAIVTEAGGRMSHAATTARRLGIPAVVGAKDATKLLQNGTTVTVNGTKGIILKNILSQKEKSHPKDRISTATKLLTIISESPPESFANGASDGVGILKAEPIIHSFEVHPKKLFEQGKKDQLTEQIAVTLERICASYSPRPVIYRSSDLLSHELRKLHGGHDFEPVEHIPTLGLRGSYRYVVEPGTFLAELDAIRKVRREKKYQNLWLLLPYVRSVKELTEAKKMIASAGLYRSGSFKLLLSVDVPSTVIQIQKYLTAGIDGISLNLDSLRTLLLGTDTKNSEVSHLVHDLDDSVLWALEHSIKEASRHNLFSSLVSEHTPLHPDLIEKIIGWGITSITLPEGQIAHTRKAVAAVEKKLVS